MIPPKTLKEEREAPLPEDDVERQASRLRSEGIYQRWRWGRRGQKKKKERKNERGTFSFRLHMSDERDEIHLMILPALGEFLHSVGVFRMNEIICVKLLGLSCCDLLSAHLQSSSVSQRLRRLNFSPSSSSSSSSTGRFLLDGASERLTHRAAYTRHAIRTGISRIPADVEKVHVIIVNALLSVLFVAKLNATSKACSISRLFIFIILIIIVDGRLAPPICPERLGLALLTLGFALACFVGRYRLKFHQARIMTILGRLFQRDNHPLQSWSRIASLTLRSELLEILPSVPGWIPSIAGDVVSIRCARFCSSAMSTPSIISRSDSSSLRRSSSSRSRRALSSAWTSIGFSSFLFLALAFFSLNSFSASSVALENVLDSPILAASVLRRFSAAWPGNMRGSLACAGLALLRTGRLGVLVYVHAPHIWGLARFAHVDINRLGRARGGLSELAHFEVIEGFEAWRFRLRLNISLLLFCLRLSACTPNHLCRASESDLEARLAGSRADLTTTPPRPSCWLSLKFLSAFLPPATCRTHERLALTRREEDEDEILEDLHALWPRLQLPSKSSSKGAFSGSPFASSPVRFVLSARAFSFCLSSPAFLPTLVNLEDVLALASVQRLAAFADAVVVNLGAGFRAVLEPDLGLLVDATAVGRIYVADMDDEVFP
ncbi:hypothetical protein KC363_g242 [Hortaea werneckii]|nr:hypothetical protein KC363_g242 [Hortaea werneckii]